MGADLHIHSTYSDGSYKPVEIIKIAKKENINTVAIADHDTVRGVEEAIVAGKKNRINIIPALELSTFRGKAEIHILGYHINYMDKRLLAKIKEIFTARITRARKMVELLNKNGINITFNQVKSIADDDYIGRPHIARAMVEAGYIDKIADAFTADYIGNGGKAYVSKYKISPKEAITIIKEAGGISVLAHPVFINHGQSMIRDDIQELLDHGLQGLEVYHSKHSNQDSAYYKKIAEEFNLLITGGSDFHGENSPGVKIGDVVLADKYVNKLNNFKN